MQLDAQARGLFPLIYQVTRQVPRGQVTTYGDIAAIIGQGCDARIVGYAMANCPDDVPWQRVVNAQGKISLRPGDGSTKQRMRLEAEGIAFDQRGKIDLARHRWAGPSAEWAAANGVQTLPPSPEPSQPSLL